MPTVHVRLQLKADVASIVKIEAATFGSWGLKEFTRILKDPRSVCYVAFSREEIGPDTCTEYVIGFVVLQICTYEVRCINLAATWPEARKKLIEKAQQRAERHKMYLTWEEA